MENRLTIFYDLPVTRETREEIKTLKGKQTYNNFLLNGIKLLYPHLTEQVNIILKTQQQLQKQHRSNPRAKRTNKNFHCSTESKLRMRLAKLGKKRPPFTMEWRKNLGLARLRKIIPNKDSKPEKILQTSLDQQNIKYEKHKAIIGQPDIFIEPNICIFVDGDYFHANPQKFKSNDIIHKKPVIITAKEIWTKDIRITTKLQENNYTVIRIWESTILNNTIQAIELIKKEMNLFSS